MKLKVLSVAVASLALVTFAMADTTTVNNSKAPTGSVAKTATYPMTPSMKVDGTSMCSKSMAAQGCMTHCGM